MIALIDADSLLYKICFALEEKEEILDIGYEGPKEDSYIIDIEVAKATFDDMVETITSAIEIESIWQDMGGYEGYELWFTGDPAKFHPEGLVVEPNFRLKYSERLESIYKSNRKNSRLPSGIEELWKYAVSKEESFITSGMEADDMVVYLKHAYPDQYFLCAIDKDVLFQTVGTHYNYGKSIFVRTTKEEALYFKYLQCLIGDPTDGYKGVPRIGDARGRKLLGEPGELNETQLWERVVTAYKDAGMSFMDAYVTMIMADMTQLKEVNGKLSIVLFNPPLLEKEENE